METLAERWIQTLSGVLFSAADAALIRVFVLNMRPVPNSPHHNTARSLVDCSAFRPSVHFTAFACVCTTFHCLSLCLHYLLLHFTAFHCVCTVVQSAFHCLSLCLRHFSEPFTAFQLCFHCLRVHFTFLVLCTAAQGEHAVFDGLARRHDHDHRFIFEEVRA